MMAGDKRLRHPDGSLLTDEEKLVRARAKQREWYYAHRGELKGRNTKPEPMIPSIELVKMSCKQLLKDAGFKSPEQVHDAIECVMDRERLERQKLKLKKIRRMIWGR